MPARDLLKHLNQRVNVKVDSYPETFRGVVKLIDDSMLTLRTFPTGHRLRSEEIDIPCDLIISVQPEKWQ